VLSKSGTEYTSDMNIPFESKYWNFEKDLKTKMETYSVYNNKIHNSQLVVVGRVDNYLPPIHRCQLIQIFCTVNHCNCKILMLYVDHNTI